MTALLTDNLPLLADSPNGIRKLRELILELAVRGKLVPQDPSDEPASELLKRIAEEKARLVAEGRIRKQKPLAEIVDEEKPYGLPGNWEWVRLPEIYYPLSVSGNKLLSSQISDEGEFPVVDQGKRFVAGYTDDESLLIRLPGPVVVFGDHTTERKYVDFDFVAGADGVKILRPVLQDERFFWWQLVGLKLEGRGYARHFKVLNDAFFALPPKSEQSRIVAKVDELMALCDRLEARQADAESAHARLVQALLDSLTQASDAEDFAASWQRLSVHFHSLFTSESSIDALKQTLLQLAVMGKLVPQDPSDEPASELLKRIAEEKARLVLEGILKKTNKNQAVSKCEALFAKPLGWEWVKFDHIAANERNALKAGPFGSALKKDMYVPGGYKVYGQEQVISGDENFGSYYISEEKYKSLESCAVNPGDILISLVGTIGRVLVLSDNCAKGIINPRLVKISLFKDVDRGYITKVLASPLLRNELAEKSHGGTMDILNLGLLRSLVIPLPPVPEQKRIVAKVNQLMALCDQLKSRLTAARQLHERLAGALVEQAVA